MGVTQVAVWCQAAQSVHGVFEQRRTVRNSAIHILILVEQPNEEIELGIQGHLQSALSRRILRILSNCERTELSAPPSCKIFHKTRKPTREPVKPPVNP